MRHGVPSEHIYVNGNPSFELYREPYCKFFPSRSELAVRHSLSKGCRWLFFPENYFWAMCSNVAETYIRRGASPESVAAHRDASKRSLAEVVQWWGRVAEEMDVEIIVRPRPAVPARRWIQTFEEGLGQIPECIHIIKEGSVREWVLACDAVFSSYSTTLLEAAIAGRPAYMLEPVPCPECYQAPWYNTLPHITTLEEMMSACNNGEGLVSEQLQAYAQREGLPCIDAFDGLCQLLFDLRKQSVRPAVRNTSPRWMPRLRKGLLRFMGKNGGVSRDLFECDEFTQDDVRAGVKRWETTIGEVVGRVPRP